MYICTYVHIYIYTYNTYIHIYISLSLTLQEESRTASKGSRRPASQGRMPLIWHPEQMFKAPSQLPHCKEGLEKSVTYALGQKA